MQQHQTEKITINTLALMGLQVSVKYISCIHISLTHRVIWYDGCLCIKLRRKQVGDNCIRLRTLLGLCSWPGAMMGVNQHELLCQCKLDKLFNRLWWARHSPSPHNSHQEGTCGWWWESFCSCWERTNEIYGDTLGNIVKLYITEYWPIL